MQINLMNKCSLKDHRNILTKSHSHVLLLKWLKFKLHEYFFYHIQGHINFLKIIICAFAALWFFKWKLYDLLFILSLSFWFEANIYTIYEMSPFGWWEELV